MGNKNGDPTVASLLYTVGRNLSQLPDSGPSLAAPRASGLDKICSSPSWEILFFSYSAIFVDWVSTLMKSTMRLNADISRVFVLVLFVCAPGDKWANRQIETVRRVFDFMAVV